MDGCAYQLLPQGLLTDSPLDSHTNLALPLPSRLAHLMLLAANTRQELSFAVGMHRGATTHSVSGCCNPSERGFRKVLQCSSCTVSLVVVSC